MERCDEAIFLFTSFSLNGKYFVSVHGIKYTPLGISIVFNHEMIAHRLLDHPDIDVNKKTCESTALHYAALRNSVSLIEAICAKVWIRTQIILMLSYIRCSLCSLMSRRMREIS